jgi:hypothetical protein
MVMKIVSKNRFQIVLVAKVSETFQVSETSVLTSVRLKFTIFFLRKTKSRYHPLRNEP